MEETAISIIIPVHNAGKFIRRCALSLFAQTLEEGLEYIFVDDGSRDDSVEQIQELLLKSPLRARQTVILRNPEPPGTSAARNLGLMAATGKYVAFCDADDWLEENFCESMLAMARWEDADMVVCDFVEEFWGRREVRHQKADATPSAYLLQMMAGNCDAVIWNKLIKRSIFIDNAIQFPDGIDMWEDVLTSIALTRLCTKVAYLPKTLYHYNRENPESLTLKMDDRSVHHMEQALERLEEMANTDTTGLIAEYLPLRKLAAKFHVMRHGSTRMSQVWSRKYPESDSYIFRHPGMKPYWRTAMKLNSLWGYGFFRPMSALARWMRK